MPMPASFSLDFSWGELWWPQKVAPLPATTADWANTRSRLACLVCLTPDSSCLPRKERLFFKEMWQCRTSLGTQLICQWKNIWTEMPSCAKGWCTQDTLPSLSEGPILRRRQLGSMPGRVSDAHTTVPLKSDIFSIGASRKYCAANNNNNNWSLLWNVCTETPRIFLAFRHRC